VDKGENKHISDRLMKMKMDNVSALLKGLFDTDGYVDKNRGPGFSNTSERLVKQVQKLLLRFGIVSSIKAKKEGTMNICGKEYFTKPHFELSIQNKRSMVEFNSLVGFGIDRKQKALQKFIDKFNLNLNYVSCKKCNYRIHRDIFSGRTAEQKRWGTMKLKIINLLGEKKELGCREMSNFISGEPRKNELRLNHHYALIKKRKIGKISRTEWFWSLNDIGKWIFSNITSTNKTIEDFVGLSNCPLCGNDLERTIKKGWRDSDFDGDIFWDKVRDVKYTNAEKDVYDLVISDKPKNDHMFVANGFIVHNSWGVNLPAYRVVIRDLKRFSAGYGSDYIPALDVMQMMGRAGRPKYDREGEAILIAKSEGEAEYVFDNYINGEPEKIQSKLGVEPVLRMHSLALIASGMAFSKQRLLDFFSKTFYAKQYGDMSQLNSKLDAVLEMLKDFGFVKSEKASVKDNPFRSALEMTKADDRLEATVIGRRVSELYLDPLTANYLIKNMGKAGDFIDPFALFQMISRTTEMRPMLSIRKKDMKKVNELLVENEKTLVDKPPNPWDVDYEDYVRSVKTAWFFSEWTDELGEDKILENFGVAPGELHVRLSNADWLIYAAHELALLTGRKELLRHIKRARIRVKYGIREELLPLVILKGIGRARARMLFGSNLRSLADLRRVPLESLSKIIGQKIAKDIKDQLNEIKDDQKILE
jgi:helicase